MDKIPKDFMSIKDTYYAALKEDESERHCKINGQNDDLN